MLYLESITPQKEAREPASHSAPGRWSERLTERNDYICRPLIGLLISTLSRFSSLAVRLPRNDVLRFPGLEVVINFNDSRRHREHPVNPRPSSAGRSPSLPLAQNGQHLGRKIRQSFLRSRINHFKLI